MIGGWIDELMTHIAEQQAFADYHFLRADSGENIPFPLRKPLVSFGEEEQDQLGYLLGCEDCLFGGSRMTVRVMTDEQTGGAFCEGCAEQICKAVLQADLTGQIVSVCVEKCMYDKTAFAYKVIMRFTLREQAKTL